MESPWNGEVTVKLPLKRLTLILLMTDNELLSFVKSVSSVIHSVTGVWKYKRAAIYTIFILAKVIEL